MTKKREHKVRINGQPRKEIDTRRLARAIVRLAVSLDVEHAQMLADALEQEEDERRIETKRARAEQHRLADEERDRGAA